MPKGYPNLNPICSVEGCHAPTCVRGWCKLHYGRWQRHGDPLRAPAPKNPIKPHGSCYDVNCGCATSLRIKAAREYVDARRAETCCERCGAQPIDWHHDDHPQNPYLRISRLRGIGASIERIQREIDRCQALCRSCHMDVDGRRVARIAALHAGRDRQPYRPTKKRVPELRPCADCQTLTKVPFRKGRCKSCYRRYRVSLGYRLT